jgi:hypothetical protein
MMAHYFFQANYRGTMIADDIGEEFSTVQQAEAHAGIVANELSRNGPQPVTVSVLSDQGILLASIAAEDK